MLYQDIPKRVDAIQLTTKIALHSENVGIYGNPGDWLVKLDNGELAIVSDDDFKARYEEVPTYRLITEMLNKSAGGANVEATTAIGKQLNSSTGGANGEEKK